MITKKMRRGLTGAIDTCYQNWLNYNARTSIKAVIVRLAVWGLLPVSLADWLIQQGGLSDE